MKDDECMFRKCLKSGLNLSFLVIATFSLLTSVAHVPNKKVK